MTKIKKLDPKSAQSVFSFACPCLGACYACSGGDMHYLSMETLSLPGMQTVHY